MDGVRHKRVETLGFTLNPALFDNPDLLPKVRPQKRELTQAEREAERKMIDEIMKFREEAGHCYSITPPVMPADIYVTPAERQAELAKKVWPPDTIDKIMEFRSKADHGRFIADAEAWRIIDAEDAEEQNELAKTNADADEQDFIAIGSNKQAIPIGKGQSKEEAVKNFIARKEAEREAEKEAEKNATSAVEAEAVEANDWPADFQNVTAMTTVVKMTSHPDHKLAKAGDKDAAVRLVTDLLSGKEQQRKIKELGDKYPDAIVVPVHAEEKAGRNRIPEKLADYIGKTARLEVDNGIVQTEKVGHTGADAWHRLAFRAKFDGEVKPGKQYILVDDVVTAGGTFGELRHYIESKGGKVVHMTSAGTAQFSAKIALSEKTRLALEQKYDVQLLRKFLKEENIYGGNYKALTESEARTILGAGSLDTARDRITTARQKGKP